ncbi:MAG TPA: hypothetical protein VNT75_20740 [Symbiobacteriaceae bacterium]|nr:hypothetical protein [Symbiobacteriaceae bacterium]
MRKWFLKYLEVGLINIRSRWAYLWDQLISNWFLAVILFVFVQLWKVTFSATGGGVIDGYSMAEMIWYLVATEVMVFATPGVHWAIEQEVKGGDLAIRLNKPYSYLLFHFSAFIGEGIMKLLTAAVIGGLTAYLLIGGFDFRWQGIPMLLVIWLTTMTINFFYTASIGLGAFWLEDIQGPYFVFDRLKWILGGLLLPIEVYPDFARRIAEALPFRHMIGGPARLFVKFTWEGALALFQSQLLWTVVFGLICAGIYRLGVRRVDVNGG